MKEKDRLLMEKEVKLKVVELENKFLEKENNRLKSIKVMRNNTKHKTVNPHYTKNENNYNMIHSYEIKNEYTSDVLSIDPDQMTYEQLLELGEKIGNVCRGFKESEIKVKK